MEWIYKYERFNKILQETDNGDYSPKHINEIAKLMAAEIECKPGFGSLNAETIIKSFKRVRSKVQFNLILNDIYDYADENKIWLGI